MSLILILYFLHCDSFIKLTFPCRYDGQRAQVHKLMDGSIKIFSRNGEETTSRFPDLVKIISESSKQAAETYILDGEVIKSSSKVFTACLLPIWLIKQIVGCLCTFLVQIVFAINILKKLLVRW